MGRNTLGIDLYQLTTAAAHTAAGRLRQRLSLSFFFREQPANRNYVVFCGLRACLQNAAELRLSEAELDSVMTAPALAPWLDRAPGFAEALRTLNGFDGDVDALPEGTLAFAAPGLRPDGTPFMIGGVQVRLYTPLIQVTTDLLTAKMIETPWLGHVNYMSMVASKAARLATAAGGKAVVEFGARRAHPDAAVAAAYAAYLGGCAGTSNVAAHVRYGMPLFGTMDHFAVQATERAGVSSRESELQAFREMVAVWPGPATLLVDTYDTAQGLQNAAAAAGARLGAVRIDSNVSRETVRWARGALREAGAGQARILVSDRLDEHRIAELRDDVDAFGVGEAITCSPDSATGVGAVAKLVVTGAGQPTMKLSRGSGKATLPGILQVWRFPDYDMVALADEAGPPGARPLLVPVWRGRAALPLPSLEEARDLVRQQIAALPQELTRIDRSVPRRMVASQGLVDLVERLCHRCGVGG